MRFFCSCLRDDDVHALVFKGRRWGACRRFVGDRAWILAGAAKRKGARFSESGMVCEEVELTSGKAVSPRRISREASRAMAPLFLAVERRPGGQGKFVARGCAEHGAAVGTNQPVDARERLEVLADGLVRDTEARRRFFGSYGAVGFESGRDGFLSALRKDEFYKLLCKFIRVSRVMVSGLVGLFFKWF